MKLGTETGSLVNHMYADATGQPKPEIGMGATILCWTDRLAGTITEVGHNGAFLVREDKAARTDNNGMSEAQAYTYEPDPQGRTWTFEIATSGKHAGQYRPKPRSSERVLIGERRKYHDFSF
jgi:hypothetical protein